MITNFQYISNPQSVIGDETWINVNSKFLINDFKFVYKRDAKDLLIIRKSIDCELFFYDTDFDNLLNLALAQKTVKCRFTEVIGSETKLHYGFLTFNKKIDFKVNSVSANIIYLDKYSKIIDGVTTHPNKTNEYYKQGVTIFSKNTEFKTKNPNLQNLERFRPFFGNNMQVLKFKNEGDGDDAQGISSKVISFYDLLYRYFKNPYADFFFGIDETIIINSDNFELIMKNLYVSKKGHFKDSITFDTPTNLNDEIDISLNDVFTVLRDNFFVYWYLTDNNEIKFRYLKDYTFSNNYDYTAIEKLTDKKLETDNFEFSKVIFSEFDKNETNGRRVLRQSEIFSNQILTFNNESDNTKEIKGFSSDVYNYKNTNDLLFLNTNQNTISFPYSDLTKVFAFRNPTEETLEAGASITGGTWINTKIINNSDYDLFLVTKWIPFVGIYNNGSSASDLEKISCNFIYENTGTDFQACQLWKQSYNPATGETIVRDVFPSGIKTYQPTIGFNSIANINNYFNTGADENGNYWRMIFSFRKNTNQQYTIKNFNLQSYHSYSKVVASGFYDLLGDKAVANYYVSNYYLTKKSGKVCEMPDVVSNENVTVLKKRQLKQEISVKNSQLIDNIDFNSTVKTSFGFGRIDSIERKYTKDYFSETVFNLSF